MFKILLFLFFFAPVLLYAQGVAPLGADEPMRALAAEVEMIVDAGGAMTLDDVLKAGSGFAPARMPFSGGYTRKVHWFRITLRRGADAPADWLLSATPAYLDDLRFYSPDAGGGFSVQQAGDRFAASGRPIDYQFGTYAFTLAFPDTLPRIFYLRLQTGSTSALNLAVATPQALAAYDSKQKLLSGLILGALALLAINALMMGYWLRDSAYPLFAGYAFSGMLLQAAKEGLVGQYLFPTMPAIANLVAPMSSCLLAAFSIAFFSAFLEMRRYYPRLRYLLLGIVALAALTLLGLAFDLYVVMAPVLFLTTLLAFLSVLFVIWRLMCMKLPGSQPLFYGYLIYTKKGHNLPY